MIWKSFYLAVGPMAGLLVTDLLIVCLSVLNLFTFVIVVIGMLLYMQQDMLFSSQIH